MPENKFTTGMPTNTGGGDWYKLAEGQNRVRILSEGAVLAEHFNIGVCVGKEKGCKGCDVGDKASYKKLFWIIDRKDSKMKLAKFGSKILTQLGGMSEDADYAFSSFPMPYDIKINAKGAGTMEVEYTVTPSPATPLTEAEQADLAKEKTPAEIVQAMKNKVLGIKNEVASLEKTAGNWGDAPTYEYPQEEGVTLEDIEAAGL